MGRRKGRMGREGEKEWVRKGEKEKTEGMRRVEGNERRRKEVKE